MRKLPAIQAAEAFREIKSDYTAATPNRFRRTRTGLHGSGDSHYANEFRFLQVREYVRDMDRNDSIIGQTVNRAVDNMIQGGFGLEPKTGDRALDRDLRHRWSEWRENEDACDIAGEFTFPDMEWHAERARIVDGDVFAFPLDTGQLQLVEADRCRTPSNTRRNVVHGVLLDENRRHVEYWFSKNQLNPHDRLYRVSDMERYATRDDDGNRQVFHHYRPSRISQTRGVSAFAPVFDISGMFEDTNFAVLVKQQMAACLTAFLERSGDFQSDVQTGERREEQLDDSTSSTIEGLAPGLFIRGKKGEKLTVQSPNIPSSEYFEHMRFLLTIIGINIGMPLVMVLMDASETNFSGWRGAIEQARLGFRCNQARLKRRFHTPAYLWKVRQWMTEDAALRTVATRSGIQIFRHKFNSPSWPYIEPYKDAQADAFRQENLLASPSQIGAERGYEFEDVLRETVRDRGRAIMKAIRVSKSIKKKTGVEVHWREVLNQAAPKGEVVFQDLNHEDDPATPAKPPAKAPAK